MFAGLRRKHLLPMLWALSLTAFLVITFFFDIGNVGNLWVEPAQDDFSFDCSYPVDVVMNTSGEKIAAADVKMFLSGLEIVGWENLSGMDRVDYKGTGLALGAGFSGMVYEYFNTYQDSFSTLASGSNLQLIRLYVMPISGWDMTGYINFYTLGDSVNADDSNMSFGIRLAVDGNPTHYDDMLSYVSGGVYAFNNLSCSGALNFEIKVFPGSRSVDDFSNIGQLKFYNQFRVLIHTGTVVTSSTGVGYYSGDLPVGTYYVVYKGQSHLASYLSGITISNATNYLDFTTGTNLFGTENKSISEDDGYQYQIAGDLLSDGNEYDYTAIGNDIAIIVGYGLGITGDVYHPANLNGDVLINASDLAVIGVNFEKKDIFYGLTPQFPW